MTDRLTSLLAERPWLLADGATGSNLFDRGLGSGGAPELWDSEHPQRIAELHRAFVEAGADIILTNTFGGARRRNCRIRNPRNGSPNCTAPSWRPERTSSSRTRSAGRGTG